MTERNSTVWPGEIIAVNGSASGPFNHAPSSTFNYDVIATTDNGNKTWRGIRPRPSSRWDDSIDMWPLAIGEPVTVFQIGEEFVLKDAEHVPYIEPCPPV